MRTHLSIYKVILCGVTLSHHPNNCSKMSRNTFVDKAQNTIADSQTKFFNFASEPLGSCLQPLSFSSFLLQLICFVIELWFFGSKCRYNFWFHQIFFKKSLEKRNQAKYHILGIVSTKKSLYLCIQIIFHVILVNCLVTYESRPIVMIGLFLFSW